MLSHIKRASQWDWDWVVVLAGKFEHNTERKRFHKSPFRFLLNFADAAAAAQPLIFHNTNMYNGNFIHDNICYSYAFSCSSIILWGPFRPNQRRKKNNHRQLFQTQLTLFAQYFFFPFFAKPNAYQPWMWKTDTTHENRFKIDFFLSKHLAHSATMK